MAKSRKRTGLVGSIIRYFAPRIWAAVWLAVAGSGACVLFNLASRHGVLAPEAGTRKAALRPSYGTPSPPGKVSGRRTTGQTTAVSVKEQPSVSAEKMPAIQGTVPKAVGESPIAATAVVLVKNDLSSTVAGDSPGKEAPGPAKIRVITLAEATGYLESHSAVFVDARSAQRFGMGHVPGALNIPSASFDKGFAGVGSKLPVDGDIVVYCESSHCDQAEEVLKKLAEKGFRRLLHFKEGWLYWEMADQIQEKGGGE